MGLCYPCQQMEVGGCRYPTVSNLTEDSPLLYWRAQLLAPLLLQNGQNSLRAMGGCNEFEIERSVLI